MDPDDASTPDEPGTEDESEEPSETDPGVDGKQSEQDAEPEEAWDEGIEDLPEVEEAWGSVIDDAPEHAGGTELGERIDHDVSRGGVQRTLLWVASALAVVLALAIVVAILRNDSGEGAPPVEDSSSAPAPAPPPADDSEGIQINPAVDIDFTAVLDEIVALEEGSGPQSERIVLEVDDSDLPAPLGTVTAALIFFDGTPQVLIVGPSRWLNSACIQTTVATETLESVDAAYHDTPTGECLTAGIGRQSQVSCIGDDVIMVDLDLVDAGATSGSERLVAESVRVALVDFPADYESVSLLGTVDLPEGFSVTDLPLARAPLGSELTISFPGPTGDVEATCFTR
jgi:hypothetical protein